MVVWLQGGPALGCVVRAKGKPGDRLGPSWYAEGPGRTFPPQGQCMPSQGPHGGRLQCCDLTSAPRAAECCDLTSAPRADECCDLTSDVSSEP